MHPTLAVPSQPLTVERREALVSVGDDVEVLLAQPYCWTSRRQPEPDWTPGFRVVAITGAGDRSYRIDVDGPRTIHGCAPECVRHPRVVAPAVFA